MLTIRAEQMEALGRTSTEAYIGRLAAHLTQTAFVAEAAADGQAREALHAARHFDLITEQEIAEFAVIICRHLGGFPLPPLPKSVQNGLLAYGVPAGKRLLTLRAWAEAK